MTLTLTLDRVIRHTVVHHSSTSTCIPNFMGIGKTFCERTDVRTDGHLTHVIRSTLRSRPNNIVICKVCKVSSNAESEAPAVARWAALAGYAKRNVLRRCLKVSVVGESLVSKGKSLQTVGAIKTCCKSPTKFTQRHLKTFLFQNLYCCVPPG